MPAIYTLIFTYMLVVVCAIKENVNGNGFLVENKRKFLMAQHATNELEESQDKHFVAKKKNNKNKHSVDYQTCLFLVIYKCLISR